MKRLLRACLLFLGLCWLPAAANAKDCAGLPTHFTGGEFPTGNFFSNFNNECYMIPFSVGDGSTGKRGDLNSIYLQMFYCAVTGNPACNTTQLPPYQLIIVGEFPNTRYFSIGLYDDHSAVSQSLTDVNIVPLTANDVNPYAPGVAYVSGQYFAVPINLGGTPGNLEKGCMMTGFNVAVNGMDGTERHPYINWNLDKGFLQQGTHLDHIVDTPEHSNPNTAGIIMIRDYLDLTPMSTGAQPHVIVRDVASGCAYPADYVMTTLSVVMSNPPAGVSWQDQQQVNEHDAYANWQDAACWGNIDSSELQWRRGNEYTPGANPDASYMYADVPAGLTQTLFNAGEVIRLRFRVPTTPPTPCTDGCSRSGNEQIRYVSISFQAAGGITLASIPDSCPLDPLRPCTPMVQDPNGYVTLILGMGAPPPVWVTAANGYTWLDLSQNPSFSLLNQFAIRDILPSGTFQCTGNFVPFKVTQATYTKQGTGLMGQYAPVIDYPVATTLPTQASPVSVASTCAVYPDGPPATIDDSNHTCSIQPPPPIAIATITTQCAAPDCNQVVVQAQPPISILGNGFGSFPLGLPFAGTSNFLEISDSTQNWSAGYSGNPCNVQIGEWSGTTISLVADVDQDGVCPMAAGDQLTVTVWNPQTLSKASLTAIVAAPSGGSRKP